MLRIHRLYSEQNLFDEIFFLPGINLIVGEKNPTSEKTNGVGKSLSIEFINFCLLKSFKDCRVSRIPAEEFSHTAPICLDFSIHDVSVTIKRTIAHHDCPTLVINGESTNYENLKDANSYLTTLLFKAASDISHPSFRAMLGPLLRDERSEFKSIIKCFDTALNIPPDYSPHLYLLGIKADPYLGVKRLQTAIDNTSKARAKLKSDVEGLTGKKFKEARADLNELSGQVSRIQEEMEKLESVESFDIVKDELIRLELELDSARQKQMVLKSELERLNLFKGNNYIDDGEVIALYNKFKSGLGEIIKREIDEVTAFKRKIDTFQQTLIESRRDAIHEQLAGIRTETRILDIKYKEKLALIDQKGALKNLKITVVSYQRKLEELSQLSSFITKYNEYDEQIKQLKQERAMLLILLDSSVKDARPTIEELEERILEIHEFVMGNRKSYFDISVNNDKEVLKFELRIDDDGSHSNEREKVFFYDIAMLLSKQTRRRHPGLLVHDNIFDVDQDTLIRSLNYLEEHEDEIVMAQYILTINSDKLHASERQLMKLDLDNYKRAVFTKEKRFLRRHYQEI